LPKSVECADAEKEDERGGKPGKEIITTFKNGKDGGENYAEGEDDFGLFKHEGIVLRIS